MSDPTTDAVGEDDGLDPTEDADDASLVVVLLDVLPTGRPGDGRPSHRTTPVAYGLGVSDFRLYELTMTEGVAASVTDRLSLDDPSVQRYHEVAVDDITRNAAAEIEYAVEDIVTADERRFAGFFNTAEPISLRLHQLNLLPGIGEKLRNNVLDERKRGPFDGFDDISERVSGLHRPREVVVERILEEITDDDMKYRVFVARKN